MELNEKSFVLCDQWRFQNYLDVWGKNLLLGKMFAENCQKMKEMGPSWFHHL